MLHHLGSDIKNADVLREFLDGAPSCDDVGMADHARTIQYASRRRNALRIAPAAKLCICPTPPQTDVSRAPQNALCIKNTKCIDHAKFIRYVLTITEAPRLPSHSPPAGSSPSRGLGDQTQGATK